MIAFVHTGVQGYFEGSFQVIELPFSTIQSSHPSADAHPSEQVAGSTPRPNLSADPKDEWALQLTTLHRLQSIMEAIDFDGSSVVTIEEVNVFTDAKPQDWR